MTERERILVMGDDEVYPLPNQSAYEKPLTAPVGMELVIVMGSGLDPRSR